MGNPVGLSFSEWWHKNMASLEAEQADVDCLPPCVFYDVCRERLPHCLYINQMVHDQIGIDEIINAVSLTNRELMT